MQQARVDLLDLADVAEVDAPDAPAPEAESFASFEAPSAEALDRLYRPEALDTPVLVPRDGPIASLDPASVGSMPTTPVTLAEVAPVTAAAVPAPVYGPLPAPTGPVMDYAGVLDAATKQALESRLIELRDKTNPKVELAVAIVNTTGDRPIFDYSLAVARGWYGVVLAPLGLLALAAYSLGIELVQLQLARLDRACDVTDVVDNVLGAGIGFLLGVLLLPLTRPWRGRRTAH